MQIETARLRLRALREEDAEDLARIFADPSVVQYSGGRSPTLEEVREGIRQHVAEYYRDRGYGLLVAELRATGEIVGRVGFLTTEIDGTGDAELHYHLAPAAWGDGLATEAAQAVLEWGFDRGGLDRVVAVIHPDNHASRRVAEKCGLTFWKEMDLMDSGAFKVYQNRPPVEHGPG
ncbi:MAG: GNAT family N-acetyltransferase [Gemmatimonadetes bacterium]|nr:GNAT family N-acetyltransferase [Gemmatimonadota bacterium]NNK49194.1 GNAT family N-acetyltransferase [Gemmatimonadota bacterium]